MRFFLKRLGYKGGLKKIEQQAGISRQSDVSGLNGYDAVRLWQKYRRGKKKALDLLIRYNQEDVINLKTLMHMGYEQMREEFFDAVC